MDKDCALELIGDLVMAFQQGTANDEFQAVDAVCHAICGLHITTEDMRFHVDADWNR